MTEDLSRDTTTAIPMTPAEISWGYVVGHVNRRLPPPPDPMPTPRHALEQAVLPALLRGPCGIAFSGGRDSSTVLAIATHVARREGLADPIPITRVFPRFPSTDESYWQQLVIRHLGLEEWIRVELHDELDLVGPYATEVITAHGVLWSPLIHGDQVLLEHLEGGSLLDGEGGDEVLGDEAHRIRPIRRLADAPRPVRWGRIRPVVGALAPRRLRRAYAHRTFGGELALTWLRPAALEAMRDAVVHAEMQLPLSFAASVRMVPNRRTQVLLRHNRRVLARPHDVEVTSPLLQPDVVHAIAHHGGRLGPGSRTQALRAMIPDLLPDALLARTDKTTFGKAFVGSYTQEFATTWDGSGVDTDLVDPEELRRWWLSGEENALTAALLQSAWLATR